MTPPTPLAESFAHHTEAEWRALIAQRGHAAALAAKSADGIPVGPIYARRTDGRVVAGRRPGEPWAIVERIGGDVAETARRARAAIAGGANGVAVTFETSVHPLRSPLPVAAAGDLAAALGEALPEGCHVHLDASGATAAVAAPFIEPAGAKRWRLALAFDPVVTDSGAVLIAAVRSFETHDIDGIVLADGRLWHAAGASEGQELAATLSSFVAIMRLFEADGLPLERAARRIGVALAADTDQFLTIAKFRAARLALGLVGEAVGIAELPHIHAETAWRTMRPDNPQANIMRATVAAFAAAVGGADSITVLPFDAASGGDDALARRLARNTQTILVEEANIHRVADPAAGSGVIEALTDALAEAAWRHFQRIEADGGIEAAIAAGSLPQPAVPRP